MRRRALVIGGVGLALLLFGVTAGTYRAQAKGKQTPAQLKLYDELFMEQVRIGDLLFHGDPETEKSMGLTLSKTGVACAMCHPFASDTHPYEFPKFQTSMDKFGTLRDMINWCIEKPQEGVRIDPDSDAMKALETYIYWSNRGSLLDPGRH